MMKRDTAPPMKRWNLFARELEDILAHHGLRLAHLDDRTDIHREKVRRLQQSLLRPKSFPVLNPSEIEAVIDACHLSQYERLRLHAALLATAVEAMLMNRIDQESALLATEQVFSILLQGLQKGHTLETLPISGTKPGHRRWNLFARELEDILADHGLRLAHLDDHTDIHREKVRRLQQSLLRPKSFPVLNPSEIEAVIDACHLSQ